MLPVNLTLTLPADFRGDLELIVIGSPGFNEDLIRSDFPEVTLTRRPDFQRAAGVLNGGGPKVSVRTASGAIRLRKGPAAERQTRLPCFSSRGAVQRVVER